MATTEKELAKPPSVENARFAVEVARVWAIDGQQHVTLAVGLWNDPAAWGLMLVDLARHVARAYEQKEGRAAEDVLARIKDAFDVEWTNPTDEGAGQVTG